MNHRRSRFQRGSLTIEERKSGPSVWVYRWREDGLRGTRVKRKHVVGTSKQFPSRASALKAVEGLKLDVNATLGARDECLTIADLATHYVATELTETGGKTTRTREVYLHQLEGFILPKWGQRGLADIKPVPVEAWLAGMPHANGTKVKIKGVFGALFQHAMRHGWASSNPIRLVRQSGLSSREQIVLEPFEIAALLSELQDPFRCIVLTAAVTGLRRGELFGLKWQDLVFEHAEIRVVRSVVDQIEGPPKTLASRRPLPMSVELANALSNWRRQTSFAGPTDWVFASPHAFGRQPYWPDAVLKRHVLPAAGRAGIEKRIGWHSFRRTLATLLQSSGASVKTTQELLRHASPVMTLGTYAKAVTSDKRAAQTAIAALFTGDGVCPENGLHS